MADFQPSDYWKGVILYGLNSPTYKMALGRVLLDFARKQTSHISWQELSEAFLREYCARLTERQMPQQANPSRLTVMERIIIELNTGQINQGEAIEKVGRSAFNDVIPRFQTIGTNKQIVQDQFYEFGFNQHLILKDKLLLLGENQFDELNDEITARWNLLEGAFSINQSQQQCQLGNDLREVYIADGYERKTLTGNVPFLQGYQGNVCFYCGEEIVGEIHVDHLLPRQVIQHDEVWKLVLTHRECNLQKGDHLGGPHFLEKLAHRNENIMGSNHPWKAKISSALGNTKIKRHLRLNQHYENMKIVLGTYYWGGSESYNPATDPVYKRLITVLNNSSECLGF